MLHSINKDIICNKCGMCCKNLCHNSIIFFPSDVERLCKVKGMSKEAFLAEYSEEKSIKIRDKLVKIYFMKIKEDRQCSFLKDNMCTVYSHRPIQCQRTPYHFFSYIKFWGYMPCVDKDGYPEGQSYKEDKELIRELLQGY